MANKINFRDLPSYPSTHNTREKKLYETIKEDKNIKDTFEQALVVSNMDNDGTVYTGATGEAIGMNSGKAAYECYQAAVNSASVVTPFQSADGLELKPVAAGDALEITNGTTANSKAAYTVGQDAFYFKTTMKTDDISDVTEIFAGFRKAEAYQADPDSYDEMAAFNIGKDADGQIEIHTILNNATTAETDTTLADWADGEEHTLEVRVEKDGQVYFRYDNAEPTVTAAFKFDNGEVVLPFLHLNTETGDPGVSVSLWEVGVSKDSPK